MNILENLTPQPLFSYFEKILSVPRSSGNCKAIADMLVEFAISHCLEYYRDGADNVIIIKEASMGKEALAPVILQAHTDMVCEKTAESDIDFDKDGIEPIINGDFICAANTTLGADNGIGVAVMMALLSDVTLALPRIEAVFTSDEEIGMLGAMEIDFSLLSGKRMINIDCDKEGEFIIGCAGGNVSKCTIPVCRENYDSKAYQIVLEGLKGGHSGEKINCGRANANVLLARFLNKLGKHTDYRLISIDGGLKDNAIPSLACAKIATDDYKALRALAVEFEKDLHNEYILTDADAKIGISECDYELPMDLKSTSDIVDFILLAPNGVQDMSKSIEGLVETSLNLGILSTDDNFVSASYCVRSSIEDKKHLTSDKLSKLCALYGGTFVIEGDYPAWEFANDSELTNIFADTYKRLFNKDAQVLTIHAGLECGVFTSGIKNLDCISVGPDLYDIHTPRERMSISSVKRFWDMLTVILTELN